MDARRRRWAWLTGIWAVLVATGSLLTVSWQQEPASGGSGPGWYDAEDGPDSGPGSGGGGDGDGFPGNPMHGSVPGAPQPEEGERYGELRPSLRVVPPDGGFRDSTTARPEPAPSTRPGSEIPPRSWPAPDPGPGH
ncbi:hypothetical protein [Streptomyces qinglanensis]|uniref:hypothetical protein n=1 Tax=Streptomyces qinglanensis TaxID=943816 RepID=UPI000944B010|nr:hypothetical protein [Streptomyces qinglanensis]